MPSSSAAAFPPTRPSRGDAVVVACSGLGVAGGALGIGSKVGGAGVARAVGLAVVGGVLG